MIELVLIAVSLAALLGLVLIAVFISNASRLRALEQRVEQLQREVAFVRRRTVATERVPEAEPEAPPAPAPTPTVVAAAPAPVPERPTIEAAAAVRKPADRPAAHDLEQVIGARWTTWIGIVAIVFALGFLLRWTFQNNLIGPTGRVTLGLLTGAGLVAAGLALRHRRDVAYLSEGLAGGGLACLYLSLYAAHQVYSFIAAGPAFALMAGVTVLGVIVSVATDRQATAVLSVLGGLLTPVLVSSEHPDERVLLAYLLVLDLLVLGIARFKAWPGLNRLAWAGSVILCLPMLTAAQHSPHPQIRLVLLTALFAAFAAVPLLRPWLDRVPAVPIDLILIFGNGAMYFAAVYATLEHWHPSFEAPWAVALALAYGALALGHAERVPKDEATVAVHTGAALVALSWAVPLAFDGPYVTLGWAVQAAVLLAVANRLPSKTLAVWGGFVLFALSVFRAVQVDPRVFPDRPPVLNYVFFTGLAVVAALAWGGYAARRLADESEQISSYRSIGSLFWLVAAMLLSVELWREPTGLWPAGLLVSELVAAAALARAVPDPAFLYASLALLGVVTMRLFIEDHRLALAAADRLINAPLMLRVVAAAAAGAAGRLVGGPGASQEARRAGSILSGASGVLLLVALSLGWTMHQKSDTREARLATQVGLSILWAFYAACWLVVGFVRRVPAIRYASLALLGVTIAKVFLVDMSNLEAVYRILSFLVLGIVLLGVSYVYQKLKVAEPSRE